ncbi:hypothetical protein BJI48_03470 [Helicobacter sp. 11S02596-1]|nr:hypothetical protein BJI48_03470 [Helicobacter sp. 11S02596-1]
MGTSLLNAFDYTVSGKAESFSKFGFNNTPIDTTKGKYPTESFVTMVGALQIDMNLLPKSITSQRLTGGIGGMIGGLAYDSTRNLTDEKGNRFGSVVYNYTGYWARYDGNAPWASTNLGMSENTRRYVIYNAYLDYDYNGVFGIKAGRYESSADFMSGFTQGFELYAKLKDLKLWWFSSYGRAFAYDEWLYDFYAPKTYTTKDGKTINLGIHAFKATYSHNGFSVSPFVYFSPKTYTAPMLQVGYDTNPDFDGIGFRSQTIVLGLFAMFDPRVQNIYRYGNPTGSNGQTLMIKQRFDINNYNIGGGIYKNFGNANAHVGTYGNPVGIDFWTASAYDLGASISDMMGEDAFTGFLYGGGVHGNFSWGVLGRLTTSKRSDEQSLAVNVAYDFSNNISAGLKLEYFNDITKAGYKVGDNARGLATSKDISDRSHVMTFIRTKF